MYYQPIDPALAAEQDLPVEYGALIGTADGSGQAVFPGSPAEAAGLQAGDIIVAIDGEQLAADSDLSTPDPAARSRRHDHPPRAA